MKLVAVSVGRPREVHYKHHTVVTSIFKSPVEGPVHVSSMNVDGDQQSDLTVHGGEFKAVYGYPREHYEPWARELGLVDVPWGSFGENLTTEGLLEAALRIGDRLRIGTVELEVTQPRFPCFKLNVRFDRDDMVKRLVANARSGFYFSVVREGTLQAGDRIELLSRLSRSVSIADRFAEVFHKRDEVV